jgi:hypothetical protein
VLALPRHISQNWHERNQNAILSAIQQQDQTKAENAEVTHMEAIKLKARIGTGAEVEWLEPLPDLPPGTVEIIVLYEEQSRLSAPDAPAAPQQAPADICKETLEMQDDALDSDHEWVTLTAEERAGRARRDLSPNEVADRLAWIDAHAGCIHIPAEQAMELAMDEWIAEENLDL